MRDETSAGGVVFRLDESRPIYLLIRDSYQNWGFPKGHVERGEAPATAALREVAEETGLGDLSMRGPIDEIDWYFKQDGDLIHKVCYFFLMQTAEAETSPQRDEGITACRWFAFDEADAAIGYANARDILHRAHAMVGAASEPA
ncbi:MAG TPA: NUDIX hydrolase [Gemmatimonadaceae bacterium]